ncbi:MAG TPA: hypothetical protein V6D26_23465 [Stenomitos sp.]
MKLTFRMLLVSLGLAAFLSTIFANPAIGHAQENSQNPTIYRKANLTDNPGFNVPSVRINNSTDLCKAFPKIFFPDLPEPLEPSDLKELCQRPRPNWVSNGEGGCYYFRIIHQLDSNNQCEDVIVVQPENELNDRLSLLNAEF